MTAASDHRRHQKVRELMPWWVTGTLDEAEARSVEEHLVLCQECRDEEASCRRLSAMVSAGEQLAPVPHPAHFERLLARIAEEDGQRLGRLRLPRLRLPLWLQATPWTARWLLVAQSVVLVALTAGIALQQQPGALEGPGQGATPTEAPAHFRTLSDPSPAPGSNPRVRVVFVPEAAEPEIRALLLELRAEIVAGPTRLGSYTVELPAGAAADPLSVVVEHLRDSPLVRFAEPLRFAEPSVGAEGGDAGDD